MMTNAERARKWAQRVAGQIRRNAGRGLDAGRVFITARLKETMNVPAPAKAVRGPVMPGKKLGPILYRRATTRATPGAPIRKVTGRAQGSTTSMMVNETTAVIGVNARGNPTRKHPNGFNYPAYHERNDMGPGSGQHKFIGPTFRKWNQHLRQIIGRAFAHGMRGN